MYVVYKHTTPSGKVYIGITKQKPERRWQNGNGYKDNEHFYRAILKYGWGNIKHEIVCTGLNKWQACRVEQSLIKYFDSTNPDKGYNNSIGGECPANGIHMSYETRQRMSEAHKNQSEETRRKNSEANSGANHWHYGQHWSDEVKKKMSEAHKGHISPMKGKHLSAEVRNTLSKLAKERWRDPKYRANQSAKHKGQQSGNKGHKGQQPWNKGKKGLYKHSEEARKKLSASHKGKKATWARKAVLCVETGKQYASVTEAAIAIGVKVCAVSAVLHGRCKTAGGYHWKYAEQSR